VCARLGISLVDLKFKEEVTVMKHAILLALFFLVSCSDRNNNNNRSDAPEPDPPMPDFSAADTWLEEFVAAEELYPGGSMIVVDKIQGVIHKSASGDQDTETAALLASVSKMPSVTLLMALHEDDANVAFDIQAPISSYLPWVGAWDSDITTEHLVSHRSGLPGLAYSFIQRADWLPHVCQILPSGTLLACGETIFTTPLPNLPSSPANTAADYGGSQWHLSGAVAETVGGAAWNQLWDEYIGEPCGLELTRFGNNSTVAAEWDGSTDSLIGLENPQIEGGMAANLDDYAKLLSLHLNDGACGDNQVLSPQGVAFMKELRTAPYGVSGSAPGWPGDQGDGKWPWGYAMGWWVFPAEDGGDASLYFTTGIYGSISWIDVDRAYGGLVIFEDYALTDFGVAGPSGVLTELIPIIEDALDAAR
jgi:CubicO group peptidase (beta-lactamase class C family)